MRETSKSSARRSRDPVFVERYLVGCGIDIGSGDDPLHAQRSRFPRLAEVRAWDLSDGDAQFMHGVADASFDVVHSSHCLEHLRDPREALRNWLRILKPGGFLLVSVPDAELYEGGVWPSQRNPQHRWSFTIQQPRPAHPQAINVADLIREFAELAECELVRQVRDGWRAELAGEDQTLGEAECAIEWVWRRRGPDPLRLLATGLQAEHGGDDALAERCYLSVLGVDRRCFDAANSLAHLYDRSGRVAEADAVWDACVQAMPGAHAPQIFRALHRIAAGRYDEGFALRDPLVPDRRRTPVPVPDWPRWQGQDLRDRSIVIWTEFGFGDELMFARFAAVFKALGASRVSLLCQAPVLPLLRSLQAADQVLACEQVAELEPHDYWVFPHSIPVHHSLEHHGVPADIPYLTPPAHAAAAWRARLHDDGARLRVGLVWKGNPSHENDAQRSLAGLHVLEDLFEIDGVHWVSLQAGAACAEVAEFQRPGRLLTEAGSAFSNFGETAAAVAALDLVISVDTSVAHVAGALGTPLWLLLPSYGDWRWGLGTAHCAWYPQARLFRQRRAGRWAEVVHSVKLALRAQLAQQRSEN